MEISYTPWGLTGHCTEATDAYNASICPPMLDLSNDEGNLEYGRMAKALLTHLVARYGVAEIRKWRFEFFNEPNGMAPWAVRDPVRRCWGSFCFNTSLWPALYGNVTQAVKSVDPQIRVGGPASSDGWGRIPPYDEYEKTFGDGMYWGTWAGDLINWGAENGVAVDFSSSHFYPRKVGDVKSMVENIQKL